MITFVPLLIAIVILMSFSAFFSGSETAMMTLTRSQIKRMEHGSHSERTAFYLLKHPQKLLATVLVGNMFVNNLLTLLCALVIEKGVDQFIAVSGQGIPVHRQELIGILLNIAIVTPLLMIFGELTPKSIAYRTALPVAKACAPLLRFAGWVMTPILWLFRLVTGVLQWLFRIPQDSDWDMLTKDEVNATLSASVHDGAASIPAREILQRIFRFTDIEASEIMIPRTQLTGLDDYMTLHQAGQIIRKSPHGIIPVYHEDLDDLWGVALFTDYPLWLKDHDEHKTLADFRKDIEAGHPADGCPVYPMSFTPPSAKISHILEDMKLRNHRVIAVVGEYGETLGVVTMNSILEEIIGRFAAQSSGNGFVRMSPDRYVADGMTRRRILEENLHEDFEDMESDTVGGLVLEKLGYLPRKRGVFVDIGKYRYRVLRIKDKRIEKVSITLNNATAEEKA